MERTQVMPTNKGPLHILVFTYNIY